MLNKNILKAYRSNLIIPSLRLQSTCLIGHMESLYPAY